jgi:hypothetical protein
MLISVLRSNPIGGLAPFTLLGCIGNFSVGNLGQGIFIREQGKSPHAAAERVHAFKATSRASGDRAILLLGFAGAFRAHPFRCHSGP